VRGSRTVRLMLGALLARLASRKLRHTPKRRLRFGQAFETEIEYQAVNGGTGVRVWALLSDVEALRRRLDSSWTELFASEHSRDVDGT
jgi:hypothetical protein